MTLRSPFNACKTSSRQSDDIRSGEGGGLRYLYTSVFLGHTGREVSTEIRKRKVEGRTYASSHLCFLDLEPVSIWMKFWAVILFFKPFLSLFW